MTPSATVRALLIRGMLAGLLAGLLAFGFAKVVGEPPLERAIAFEARTEATHTHAHPHADPHADPHVDAAPVSRSVQAGIGLFTGVVVHATALGGLFALVFAVANGRAARLRPRAMAALLGAIGFVTVFLAPALKYPASPPAVGTPETIGPRTAMFFVLLGVSVAAAIGAAALRKRLAERMDGWNAALVAGAGWVGTVAVAYWLLPEIDEVPDGFPADVLWQFRRAAFGVQLVLWAALGLFFGTLVERTLPR